MADEILKDMTHLGSTLADVATKQLDAMLDELSGARGAAGPRDREHSRDGHVNVGTLAVNLIELAGKAGQILTQLAKYDLVRRDTPELFVSASNPISGIKLRTGESTDYGFLLENDGAGDLKATVRARLEGGEKKRQGVTVTPAVDAIAEGERRKLVARLPGQKTPGRRTLIIEVVGSEDPTSGKRQIFNTKTIEVTVLPPPTQHKP
jgi:hypothetical protein